MIIEKINKNKIIYIYNNTLLHCLLIFEKHKIYKININ